MSDQPMSNRSMPNLDRPYAFAAYDTLLRAIGPIVLAQTNQTGETGEPLPTMDTPEGRAFYAMSELWTRLIVERKGSSYIRRYRSTEPTEPNSSGSTEPNVGTSQADLIEQCHAVVREKLESDPDQSRSEIMRKVYNLACFRNLRPRDSRAIVFEQAWQLVQNEFKSTEPK